MKRLLCLWLGHNFDIKTTASVRYTNGEISIDMVDGKGELIFICGRCEYEHTMKLKLNTFYKIITSN